MVTLLVKSSLEPWTAINVGAGPLSGEKSVIASPLAWMIFGAANAAARAIMARICRRNKARIPDLPAPPDLILSW
jgi:hypothetical protein